MGFRLVQKLVILHDLEWQNDRYFALFAEVEILMPTASNWLKLDPHCLRQ